MHRALTEDIRPIQNAKLGHISYINIRWCRSSEDGNCKKMTVWQIERNLGLLSLKVELRKRKRENCILVQCKCRKHLDLKPENRFQKMNRAYRKLSCRVEKSHSLNWQGVGGMEGIVRSRSLSLFLNPLTVFFLTVFPLIVSPLTLFTLRYLNIYDTTNF